MFNFIGEFLKSLAKPRLTDTVSANDEELVREISDGTIERVRWDALKTVVIVTTDQGPWLEDVFFVFESEDAGVVISQEWSVKLNLLDLMERKLEGLDNEQLIAAMGCTDNARFTIWDVSNTGRLATSSATS